MRPEPDLSFRLSINVNNRRQAGKHLSKDHLASRSRSNSGTRLASFVSSVALGIPRKALGRSRRRPMRNRFWLLRQHSPPSGSLGIHAAEPPRGVKKETFLSRPGLTYPPADAVDVGKTFHEDAFVIILSLRHCPFTSPLPLEALKLDFVGSRAILTPAFPIAPLQ